jgi:hypothetical protein
MDYLPKDPAILVSSVNMLLRECPDCVANAAEFLENQMEE